MTNMPRVAAAAALLVTALVPLSCTTSAPRITADTVEFLLAGDTTLTYERGHRTLKPYVRHLRTRDGIDVLQDEPKGHEHHHGLMFALGVADLDFWAERYTDRPGVQREVAFRATRQRDANGVEWPGFTTEVEWADPKGGAVVLTEQRTLLSGPDRAGPALVTWRSRFVPTSTVRLWGNPYFGLGLRLAATCDGATSFTTSDDAPGAVVRGDERLTPARWCAATGPIGGAPTTVALFAHPGNPRTPTRFFTMGRPFAYLSATLDVNAHPLELAPGEPLELTWALAMWHGAPTQADIEAAWVRWAAAFPAGTAPPR